MFKRLFAGFIAVGVICGALAPVTLSQSTQELTPEEIHWLLIEEQLVRSLDSPHEAVVVQTLHNVLLLSIMNRDRLNMHRVGDEVVRTHKKNKSPEVRQAALAALQVIGTSRAAGYARSFSVDENETSHILAMQVFESYFGNRYMIAAQEARQ